MKLSLPHHIRRALMAALLAGTLSSTASAMNDSWELVFNDEFTASSFSDGKLNWNTNGGQWNKIDYVNGGIGEWRIYQSRDDALVTSGSDNGTDYVRLKGAYGDYTSQSDQTGAADTYACGGIFTNNTFTFQYGYVEVRARFESYQGCWPAIWLMPKNSTGWPQSGEIDIMEHINYQNKVHQTLHFHNNAGTGNAQVSHQTNISNRDGWHTYGVEWTETDITFYVDGSATSTVSASQYTNWPFSKENHEFYLLIDQQIGGSWTGNGMQPGTWSDGSADFDIDYVRVYSTSKDADTDYAGWSSNGPVDAEGNAISYTDATGSSGTIEPGAAGNYKVTATGNISNLLAKGSHLQLCTESGSNTINMSNALVQADSLYITDGKYTGGTLDVDTVILNGGSLQISDERALSSVKKLYLGYESDAIGSNADRNATLYFAANQKTAADVVLINDTKIGVYQGKTAEFTGNVTGGSGYTLNLVGLNSSGTGTIKFSGEQNQLDRVSMGIGETVNGHAFNGWGQVLDVRFGNGSNTTIGELVTNSPTVITGTTTGSSIHVESGATLSITKNWTNHSATNAFNVNIAHGGTLNIGNGTDFATADNLNGVTLTNRGTLKVNQNATLTIESVNLDASQITNGRAQLDVSGTANIKTLNMNSNSWSGMATLNILSGANANIDTINAQIDGQVNINVRHADTASINTLTGTDKALLFNEGEDCIGTFVVKNAVTTATKLYANHGKVVFEGGVSTGGSLTLRNAATATLHGTSNNVAVKFDNTANAVLEIVGDYTNSKSVSGAGTIRKTGEGSAQLTTDSANFTGSIDVQSGSMTVTGASTYDSVISQSALTFKGMSSGLQVRDFSLFGDALVSIYTNNTAATENEATITVTGTLSAAGGTLNANLVLAEGATLNFTDTQALEMGSSITLNGTVLLSEGMETLISSAGSDAIVLAFSMDGFSTDGGATQWENGASCSAADVFTANNLTLSDYTLTYYLADEADSGSGTLMLTRAVPEPATASLALLALVGLAARRRRK